MAVTLENATVTDMTLTVRSREVHRGMLAELTGDEDSRYRHYMAAGHLDLVLAYDYGQGGEEELAAQSQINAATCFWKAGQTALARVVLQSLLSGNGSYGELVDQTLAQLEREYPESRGADSA